MPGIDGVTLFAWLGARKPYLRDRLAFITAAILGQAAGSVMARSARASARQ